MRTSCPKVDGRPLARAAAGPRLAIDVISDIDVIDDSARAARVPGPARTHDRRRIDVIHDDPAH